MINAVKKISVLFSLLLLSVPTFAQDKPENQNIVYQERTEIDFDEMEVLGELVRPQGSVITDRRRAVFDSFIRLRINWDKEMKESLKEIR